MRYFHGETFFKIFKIDKLNENFNGPARPRIINQGKREMRKNKRVRFIPNNSFAKTAQIMAENKELRHALAEHQTVLEMVMNKFRKVSTHAARLEREQSFLAPANKTYELRVREFRKNYKCNFWSRRKIKSLLIELGT